MGEEKRHRVGARVAEQEQGRHEIRGVDPAGKAVDAPAALLALQDRNENLVEERLLGRRLERSACELERRREERLPAEPSSPLVRLGETRQKSRDGDRRLPDVEDLRGGVGEVDLDLVHLA